MILSTVLPWAMAAFVVALALSAWRLLQGPSPADRILALDTMYINALALLVLVGLQRDTTLYFEAALIIAMLGFAGTVVLARHLHAGDGGE